MTKTQSVLFVCMGNICRSPMAEGLFSSQVLAAGLEERFIVDSAGTGAWHEGDPPDRRGIATMKKYGIDISNQVSRPISDQDFQTFDPILAMDHNNLSDLRSRSGMAYQDKLHLFMDFSLGQNVDIPDPYYGSGDGFELVYKMLLEGCTGLLGKLKSE